MVETAIEERRRLMDANVMRGQRDNLTTGDLGVSALNPSMDADAPAWVACHVA